jgi:murein L,D-transpeptidase YafK
MGRDPIARTLWRRGNGRAAYFDSVRTGEAFAVKHRKWIRFLGLSTACVASLCLGAFLSYQASMQAEAVAAPASVADSGSVAPALAENIAPAAPAAIQHASADDRTASIQPASAQPMVLASLEAARPPLFSAPNGPAAPLALQPDETPSQSEDAALHDGDLATPADANPQTLPLPPERPDDQAMFHGKPAPLPPVRPASLTAPPAATVAALPEPPPVPTRPEAVVAAPTPSADAALPSAAALHSAAVLAPQPPSQNAFPSVANALAAVTASVGGASAAVTPTQSPQVAAQPGEDAEVGGFKKGSPVYVRIFKKEGVLELWLKRGDRFALYKSYPVCKWSGQLGPKTQQADYQSPEGFYSVSARQLNPNSHYHLAFDVGYPNAYDRRQGSTGNAVMVHGDCKSVGCFAMTNSGIDEIYGIVEAALRNGQREVPVHIFPFRMTEEAIARESAPKPQFMAFLATSNSAPRRDWSGFWRNLKQGYDLFERSHVPPVAYACGDRYEFGAAAGSCARIAGW